mmetsp:Transcript_9812/g.19879  ORF Transcript_9812/g.19879 Transcript_9812/m.19879 type:complete len:161 (+) Transcript_9812:382-864(+)
MKKNSYTRNYSMFNQQLLHQMKKAMLLILLLPFSFCHAQVSKPPNKKNIVLLFADDVGIGNIPGYVNNPPVELPNIDSLRLKGITYKNFHATPWCSPSRYALLSGNYQFRGMLVEAIRSEGLKSIYHPGSSIFTTIVPYYLLQALTLAGHGTLGGKGLYI